MSLSAQAMFTFAPPNNFNLLDDPNKPGNITEQQFNTIVNSIVAIWQPIAKAHGAVLTADANWKDSTVNAYAEEKGNSWMVHFFGGLARRPEITPDGFALVVCHELGHHFGGYYFYGDKEWAAAEGQADYFATQMCGRHIFANLQNNIRFLTPNAPEPVKENCTAVWGKDPKAVAECARISAASLSLATLLAKLGNSPAPHFETPDKSQVSQTNVAHPAAQCRLDTYFAGALCSVTLPPDQTPGRGNPAGNNSKDSEAQAYKFSCAQNAFKVGFRPRCWFKPQLF